VKHLASSSTAIAVAFLALSGSSPGLAQQTPAARPQGDGRAPTPQVVSPEVSADRRISFRVYAPQAGAVRLNATDIPGVGPALALTKGSNGVWEVTTNPVPAGSYRYVFNVDGVATMDPRNPSTSESNNNSWSLVDVSGSELFDTRAVPHGSVSEVTYFSTALKAFRRMHVYTPPGYETSSRKYPVFYLLHGAGDSDDSWSTVGRAGFIVDNLIATRRAKPMIVVMPAGHVRGATGNPIASIGADAFVSDFVTDVMAHVQKSYRVLSDRSNTAIAGLSMGGSQALNIAFEDLDKFGYVGVFSSGLLGAFPRPGRGGAPPAQTSGPSDWEARHAASLDNTSARKGLKLFWFSTGRDDSLISNTVATVDFFKKHGFSPVYQESAGGHTWLNWRDYLTEFAPQLFQ